MKSQKKKATPNFQTHFLRAKRSLQRAHPDLRELFVRHKGVTLIPNQRDPYESLVRSIAHQQLTGKAAETIIKRLLALFPKDPFPPAARLRKLAPEKLRACGYSASKTRSILEIAQASHCGQLPNRREIAQLNNEEIIERLIPIYGVGRWTVEMLLIFQLGRLDVWPVNDFGVRKGFQTWKGLRDIPKSKEMRELGTRFAPHASIVALYLWAEADAAKRSR